MYCRNCGANVGLASRYCPNCGQLVNEKNDSGVSEDFKAFIKDEPKEDNNKSSYPNEKSKIAAGIIAIMIGSLGAHHFYMGNIGKGILYLLFFWTGIPGIIGLVKGIIYLSESDEQFQRRFK